MFAHIYCPDLLVQCERLFRPEFASQALIIHESITQQDIDHIRLYACSSQARELGFETSLGSEQVELLIEQFSCDQETKTLLQCQPNKQLYADMSERLFSSLKILAPSVTAIASDEAWLDLTKLKRLTRFTQNSKRPTEELAQEVTKQLESLAFELRHSIKQWLGLEICVGVGATKTLAHLGCMAAEREYDQGLHTIDFDQHTDNRGVTVLTSNESSRSVLAKFPTSKIRGINAKALSKLSELGIHTALELSQASSQLIGKRCSVVVEHIAIELSGLSSSLTSQQFGLDQSEEKQLCLQKDSPSDIKTKPANKLMGFDIQDYLASYTKARLKAQLKGHPKNSVSVALLRIIMAMLTNAHKELKARHLNCHKVEISVERADLHAPDKTFIDNKSVSLTMPDDALGPLKKLCRQIFESMIGDDGHYHSFSLTLKCQDQGKAKQVGLFDVIDEPKKIAQLSANDHQFMLIQRYCKLHDLSSQKIKPNKLRRLSRSPAYTSKWHELLRVN